MISAIVQETSAGWFSLVSLARHLIHLGWLSTASNPVVSILTSNFSHRHARHVGVYTQAGYIFKSDQANLIRNTWSISLWARTFLDNKWPLVLKQRRLPLLTWSRRSWVCYCTLSLSCCLFLYVLPPARGCRPDDIDAVEKRHLCKELLTDWSPQLHGDIQLVSMPTWQAMRW